jgi:hypothetical protein
MFDTTRYELTGLAPNGRRSPWAADSAGLSPYQEAHRHEWRQPHLGRLGRRLLPEIEGYVEFFAIARGYGSA